MTIYVLRYGDLLKIGYSSQLEKRVYDIMQGIPGEVTFVGHMPGDREVEAHLHDAFSAHRFSGEWFRASPELEAFCSTVLIKDMPLVAPAARVHGSRSPEAAGALQDAKRRLRAYAAHSWPMLTHAKRIDKLSERLGWLRSRLFDIYHVSAAHRISLRATESADLDRMDDPAFASAMDRARAGRGDGQ